MKKVGIIVCGESKVWPGGEAAKGNFIKKRFENNIVDSADLTFEVIHGFSGKLPNEKEISEYLGFVISGSRSSVNDDDAWISRLQTFVQYIHRTSINPKPKLFGICFGHQLIAKALGGQVTKNASGKFIFGAETVHLNEDLTKKEYYKKVFGDRKTFKILISHGEEVSSLPEEAVLLGDSLTCKHEVLRYGDHILSTQGHPEVTEAIMKELVLPRLIKVGKLKESEIDSVIESYSGVETDTMIQFVISFLTDSTTQESQDN